MHARTGTRGSAAGRLGYAQLLELVGVELEIYKWALQVERQLTRLPAAAATFDPCGLLLDQSFGCSACCPAACSLLSLRWVYEGGSTCSGQSKNTE